MSEVFAYQDHTNQDLNPDTAEGTQAGIAECKKFLDDNTEQFSTIFGLRHLKIDVGDGWATNVETGAVTADPSFFIERGYTPDMSSYAIVHEIAAHLREIEFDPELTRAVKHFLAEPTDPQLRRGTGIFYNIMSDIAGNKLTHEALPSMKAVAHDLYSQKLFADTDYSTLPRHLQFLYKIMRQEMIDDSETVVSPEVDEVIAELRDFGGKGDIIEYSTQVAKDRQHAMPNREKFDLWTKVIYPKWLELFDLDKQDSQFQEQSEHSNNHDKPNDDDQEQDTQSASGDDKNTVLDDSSANHEDGQESTDSSNTSDENQAQNNQTDQMDTMDGDSQSSKGESIEQMPSSNPNFDHYYDDYSENMHPEPLDHDALDELEKKIADERRQEKTDQRQREREEARNTDPAHILDTQIRRETGHSLADKRIYDRQVMQWAAQISQLRDVYRTIINERIGQKRRLRGGHTEGVLVDDPAQAYIDMRTQHPEPAVYADYESYEAERKLTGRTDYVFVFDRSGSMSGEKSQAASASLVICLEALSAMEEDIREAEQQANVEVDLDIRTAVYTFNNTIDETKPLSTGLSDKERYDSYGLVARPGGGNADSHVLASIEQLSVEPERKQILIVVSDGEADDAVASRASIERLRNAGWSVYGISIGSEAAVRLYSPDSLRVDNPVDLPTALSQLIESTL